MEPVPTKQPGPSDATMYARQLAWSRLWDRLLSSPEHEQPEAQEEHNDGLNDEPQRANTAADDGIAN